VRPRSTRGTFTVAVCLLAAAGTAAALRWLGLAGDAHLATVALLALATVAAGLFPDTDPGGRPGRTLPASSALAFALVLLAPGCALLAQWGATAAQVARRRSRFHELLTVGATGCLALLTARGVFAAATGEPLAGGALVPAHLPAVGLAGVAYFAVTALVQAVLHAGSPPDARAGSYAPRLPALARSPRRWPPALAGGLPWATDVCLAPLVVVAVDFSPWLLPAAVLLIASLHRHFPWRVRAEHAALHDPATGLPNRALFHLRFEAASREGTPLAVMLVECAQKAETRTGQGDVALLVAERLRQTLRKGDNLARLNSSQFAILARLDAGSPLREAERVAQRVVAAVQDLWPAAGVTARLGMSVAPLHGTSAELLMSRADAALRLTCAGAAQWRTYDAYAHNVTPERQSLLDELRSGLELDELELRYQPKLDLRTNVVVGVEALARWRHPRRGLLGPAEFIPLAESGGLIAPLTLPLLDKALAQTAEWRRRGWELNVAVNLSATHLGDLRLPSQVADALRLHDVPPELLTLEVTESTIMSDPARAIQVLQELRTQGVRTSIDDYGTGYSSLSFLRQLQVDELKIDASFIRHLASADADEVIVASTIDLAHNLGLRVVAEGVEDLDAWRRLTSLGCDVVQGYLLSPPQAAAELTEWLGQRRVAGATATPAPLETAPVPPPGSAPVGRGEIAARADIVAPEAAV
jgi:EAL domain-containing protein (putative c-di-GMP-specific phosphodiesterase class I)/GGDEF domain-containing protein